MATNPIDLTTVNTVQAYLKLNAGAAIVTPEAAAYDDDLIQGMITGLSQHWPTQTGRASLNTTADVSEYYDGNGSYHIFTDNWPINSVALVQVGNQTVPASPSFAAFGYFVERSKKSIAIRPGGAGALQCSGASRFAATGVIMSTEIIGAPKPVCPTCGSENTNGYWGIEYGELVTFEPMECDDCDTRFDCLWTRAGVENVQPKTASPEPKQ
jgi:hypothetical protein